MEIRHQEALSKVSWHLESKIFVKLLMMFFIVLSGINFNLDKSYSFFINEETFSFEKIIFKENELSFLNYDPNFKNFLIPKKLSQTEFLSQRLMRLLPQNIRYKAKYYLKPIIEVSHYYGIDPLWTVSIVWTESHFRVHSKSHVGAKGLMQLMPITQRYLERRMKRKFTFSHSQIEIPLSRSFYNGQLRNIEVGVHYLSKLLRRFSKRNLATVAYNMGPTWTRRRLNRRLPVGKKNHYLNKVSKSYKFISKRL